MQARAKQMSIAWNQTAAASAAATDAGATSDDANMAPPVRMPQPMPVLTLAAPARPAPVDASNTPSASASLPPPPHFTPSASASTSRRVSLSDDYERGYEDAMQLAAATFQATAARSAARAVTELTEALMPGRRAEEHASPLPGGGQGPSTPHATLKQSNSRHLDALHKQEPGLPPVVTMTPAPPPKVETMNSTKASPSFPGGQMAVLAVGTAHTLSPFATNPLATRWWRRADFRACSLVQYGVLVFEHRCDLRIGVAECTSRLWIPPRTPSATHTHTVCYCLEASMRAIQKHASRVHVHVSFL
jgi:hypothetical protein